MSNVAQIQVELDLDSGSFSGKIANASGLIRNLDGDLGKAADSLARIEARTTSFSSSLRGLVVTLGQARSAMKLLWEITGEWGAKIATTGGKLEQLMQLMKGLSNAPTEAGRMADATKGFEYLINLAQHAPFQLTALQDSFVKMRTAGIDPMDGSMQALADSVAKFGGNSETLHNASIAIQQMAGKGVVSMEELRRQLGEAVPDAIQRMADGLSLSMPELVKKISTGTIASTTALKQMFFQMKLVNQGAAEDMMKTWTGMTSKLDTELQLFQDQIYKSGFGDALKEQVEKISEIINSNEGKELGANIGAALGEIVHDLAALFDFVRANWGTIKTTGELLIAAFAATKITNGIIGIGTAVKGMIAVISGWQTSFAAGQSKITAQFAQSGREYAALMQQAVAQKTAAAAAERVADTGRLTNGRFASVTMRTLYQAEALAATEAAAASEAQAAAVARSAAITRTASAAMEIALGPIGWITLALTVGLSAWLAWGKGAEDGVNRAVEAAKKGYATLQDLNQINEEIINKTKERTELEEKLRSGQVTETVGMGLDFQHQITRGMTSGEIDALKAKIEGLGGSIKDLQKASADAGTQVTAEGVRQEVDAVKRGWDEKLNEIGRRSNQEVGILKSALTEKYGATKQYDELFAKSQQDVRGAQIKEAQAYMQQELAALQVQAGKVSDINSKEAQQIQGKIAAAQAKLKELQSDAKSAANIGNFDSVAGKGKKKDPQQEALESYIDTLDGKIAKLKGEIAGGTGEWEKFKAAIGDKKFSSMSAAELQQIHDKIDLYDQLSAKERQSKKDASDLAQMGDAQAQLASKLASGLQDAKDGIKGEIFTEATAGARQLNAELQTMQDVLERTGHSTDDLGKHFKQFSLDERNTLMQTDAINFGKQLDEITKKSNAAIISNSRDAAQAELQIEIDKINRSLAAEEAELDEKEQNEETKTQIALVQSKARNAIAAKEAEFAYNNRPEWQKLLDGWQDTTKAMGEAWANSFNDMSSTLTDFLVTGKANFQDFAQSVEKEIVRVMTNKMIAQFAQMIMGAFGGGGYTGGVDSAGMDESGWYTGYAKGGVMSPMGDVPLKKYARGGIATRPQVALFGEGSHNEAFVPLPDGRRIPVAMEGGGQHASPMQANVQINVINQSGQNVQAEQKGQRFDGEKMILDVVLTAMNRPGKFRDGARAALQ